jgi:hypothetical protein
VSIGAKGHAMGPHRRPERGGDADITWGVRNSQWRWVFIPAIINSLWCDQGMTVGFLSRRRGGKYSIERLKAEKEKVGEEQTRDTWLDKKKKTLGWENIDPLEGQQTLGEVKSFSCSRHTWLNLKNLINDNKNSLANKFGSKRSITLVASPLLATINGQWAHHIWLFARGLSINTRINSI